MDVNKYPIPGRQARTPLPCEPFGSGGWMRMSLPLPSGRLGVGYKCRCGSKAGGKRFVDCVVGTRKSLTKQNSVVEHDKYVISRISAKKDLNRGHELSPERAE